MESDELDNLHNTEQHLNEWLRRYGKAKDAIPDIQKHLEVTHWEIDALENRPTVAGEVPPTTDLPFFTAQEYDFAKSAFPLMPDYNPVAMSTASSASTSGAAVVYSHIAQYANIQDANAIVFSNEHTKRYREIQAQQERPKEVRSLMQIFCGPKTLEQFDIATKVYWSSKSGAATPMDAANAIRNTLDGLKGDLFEKARDTPKENMTWVKMSQRLAKGVKESEMLSRNEAIRTSLIGGLSEILKNRSHGSFTNLDDLWTQTLDFIYAVLNLLKPIPQIN